VVHHRSDEFREILKGLHEGLKAALLTKNDVVVLTSSGTGAMEAVVASLLGPADRVLVPVLGKFSRRWMQICRVYGVAVSALDQEPGEAPSPEMIETRLRKNPDTKAVLLTHCETSTGSLTDLRELCAVIHSMGRALGRRILCCADCISSLLADELRQDEWEIDCVVAASQKGLLAPPGLAFVALGDEALRWMGCSPAPSYYFDLRRYYEDVLRCPFTPAVSLVRAVRDSLDSLLRHGLERVWAANRAGAAALRLIIETAGFSTLASNQSNAVIAFRTDDVDPERIARILLERHGIVIARGQEELRGRILRASSIGKAPREMLTFAEAFEATLADVGRKVELRSIRPRLELILEDCRIWE
jgi:aspartate aminotransferase-like enzyme